MKQRHKRIAIIALLVLTVIGTYVVATRPYTEMLERHLQRIDAG